jgi:hypothetical protein
MRALLDTVVLLAIGLLFVAIIRLGHHWPFVDLSEGELRCESGGAVIIRIGGMDYAVNGMASTRHPPVQQVWNDDRYPGTNIDRIIARGLTLCDW